MKTLTTILLTTTLTLAFAACSKGDFNGTDTKRTLVNPEVKEDQQGPSSPKQEQISDEEIRFNFRRINLIDRQFPPVSDYGFNEFLAAVDITTPLVDRGVYVERIDLTTNTRVMVPCTNTYFFFDHFHLDPSVLDVHKLRYEVRTKTEVIKTFEVEVKPDLVIQQDTDLRALIGNRESINIETLYINAPIWSISHPKLYIGALDLTINATNVVSNHGRIANFTDQQISNSQTTGPDGISGGHLTINTDYFAGPLIFEMQGQNGPLEGKGGDAGYVTFNSNFALAGYTEIKIQESPGLDNGKTPRPSENLRSKVKIKATITYN